MRWGFGPYLHIPRESLLFPFSGNLRGQQVSSLGHLQFGSVVDLYPWICAESLLKLSPLTQLFFFAIIVGASCWPGGEFVPHPVWKPL